MTGSRLATYKNTNTSNYSNRAGAKIDRIVIHHMAGNLSVETCANVLKNRSGSVTYAIETSGRIGQLLDEAVAPWTTCNYGECDRFAITIEVANDQIGGEWHVSDKALNSVINLCVDVCQRNGIKQLNYTGDKSGNLLQHCWFYATACPGPYLKSKFKYIADSVNKKLTEEKETAKRLEVDGIFGYESTKALQEWLKVQFTPDGEISGQIKSLHKYFPNITTCTWSGNGSLTVEKLQKFLTGKGFDPKGIDGLLGEDTIFAWQKWLSAQGYRLTTDGIFGPESARAMQEYLNAVFN